MSDHKACSKCSGKIFLVLATWFRQSVSAKTTAISLLIQVLQFSHSAPSRPSCLSKYFSFSVQIERSFRSVKENADATIQSLTIKPLPS